MSDEAKPPFERTVVVGLGGIWSRLWLNLGDLSAYTEGAPREIILVDGDEVEEKNIARQGFIRSDFKKKKAAVYEERMRRRYPELKIRSVGDFVTPKNLPDIVPDRTMVMLCVDNNATRLHTSRHVQSLQNAALINGGNELWDGNVYTYVRSDGISGIKPMEETHVEIQDPKDKNPGEMSCEERLAQKGGEQVLVTNAAVATHMAAMFHDVLVSWQKWRGKEVKQIAEVMFNVKDYAALGYVRAK